MRIYITPQDWLRSPTGLDASTLVGNIGYTDVVLAGATTLLLTGPLTCGLNQFDRLTIFDGASSEVVVVGSAGAAVGDVSVPVSALQYAHASGTDYCSDGASGSLAQELITASSTIEQICQQSLWQATYTETLRMPSMRASFDNQGMLTMRPRHFPVTVLSSISIKSSNAASTSYDASQAIIDPSQQVVSVPQMSTYSGGYSLYPGRSRVANLFLTLSYTAGFAPGELPPVVQDAAILLVNDLLNRRTNPMGAMMVVMGSRTVMYGKQGAPGESAMMSAAMSKLRDYVVQAY